MGIAKIFGVTPEYALYEISYVNAIMYSHATPSIDDMNDENAPAYDDSRDANNPINFNNFSEGIVRA